MPVTSLVLVCAESGSALEVAEEEATQAGSVQGRVSIFVYVRTPLVLLGQSEIVL